MLNELMKSLAFSEDDLHANQDGKLSARQQRRLWRALVLQNTLYWLIAIFFYVIAIAIQPWRHTLQDGRFWAAIGMMIIPTAVLYYLLAEGEQYAQDIKRGEVCAITGWIRCEFADHSYSRQGGDFYIQIHDQRFFVPYKAFQAFKDGGKYTLYYLPHARRVVSAIPAQT